MTPFAVYADDYSYIPIDDIEQYNAYRFWQLYGYKLDYTNTISYSENYTGSYTYTGTISGSINGGFSGSYNVEITGLTKSNDGEGENSSPGIVTSSALMQASYFEMKLVPEDPTYQTTAAPMTCYTENTATQNNDTFVNQWGCRMATNGSTSFGGYEAPTYTVEFATPLNTGLQEIGTIEMTLVSVEQGSGGLSGSISLSENESSSGSGNITLNGTSSTTGHKIYDIPSLTVNNIDNDFKTSKRFTVKKDNPYVISFITETTYAFNFDLNSVNGENVTSRKREPYYNTPIGGYMIKTYEIYNDNKDERLYITMNSTQNYIIPLYCGNLNNMSDKLYRYIYGSDRTNELLENGNSNSQQAISNNNIITNSFSQASNGMHNIETTWENNLDTNLQNVPTSSSMYNDNKFIATANWVRTQFERIVLNTPFELLLVFSLILGIALVLIGKVR